MTELRVGLVGAGMVSAYHIRGWQTCPGARLVAIADPDAARAMARAGEAGVPAFETLGAMAAAMSLDAVDITSPVATHAALVREAAASGLAVMCQKPLAPSAADAAALIDDLATEARVMVHENWRWRGPYRALKAVLDGGLRDRVDGFTLDVASAGLLPDANGDRPALVRQPFMAQMPRLIVLELLIHHLDTLAFLFGPLTVEGALLERRSDAVVGEDHAAIRLSAGGLEGELVGDFCRPGAPAMPRDALTLAGGGGATLDGWQVSVGDRTIYATEADAGYQASYSDTIRHFVEQLRSGEPFETPPQTALQTLRLIEEIYALGAGGPGLAA